MIRRLRGLSLSLAAALLVVPATAFTPTPVQTVALIDLESSGSAAPGLALGTVNHDSAKRCVDWTTARADTVTIGTLPDGAGQFDRLLLRLRSANVACQVHVVVEADSERTVEPDYYYRALELPPEDWRTYDVPLAAFEGSGEPAGWIGRQKVRLSVSWGNRTPPDTVVQIGEIILQRDLLRTVDEGWQKSADGRSQRRWKIESAAAEPLNISASPTGPLPEGLNIGNSEIEPSTIAPGATATLTVEVTPTVAVTDPEERARLRALARSAADEQASLTLRAVVHGQTTDLASVPIYPGSAYYQWIINSRRPFVLLTERKVSELRRLRESGRLRSLWDEQEHLTEIAARWWQRTKDQQIPPPFGVQRTVDVLGVGATSDRAALQDLARGLAWRFAGRESWVAAAHRPRAVDLTSAWYASTIGIAYDAMWSTLTPGERIWLRKALVEKALLPNQAVMDARRFPVGDYLNNWCAVVTSGMGIAACALLQDDPRSAIWLDREVRELFRLLNALPVDGSWPEGLSYWEFALQGLAQFSEVVRNVTQGEIDPFQHPFWQRTGDFVVHNFLPPGGWANIGDARYIPLNRGLLCRIGQEAGRPDWSSLALSLPYQGQPAELYYWPTDLPDETLPDGIPAALFPDSGWASMRSDWRDDAAVLVLRSGPQTPHSHLDQNSFILHSFGETLIKDLPVQEYPEDYFGREGKARYYWSATEGHNTVLVDGAGQRADSDAVGRIERFVTGTVSERSGAAESAGCDYVLADATQAYPASVQQALRHVIHVRRPAWADHEQPSYFLMVDELAASRPVEFEWRCHPNGKVAVASGAVVVQGQQGQLVIRPIAPQAWRAVLGEHEGGEDFIGIRARSKTQRCVFVNLLISVRMSYAIAVPDSEPAIPGPAVVASVSKDVVRCQIPWGTHTDLVEIRTKAIGPAAITLATHLPSGHLTRCAVFGGTHAGSDGFAMLGSDRPLFGSLWESNGSIQGRLSLTEGNPVEVSIRVAAEPEATVPTSRWMPDRSEVAVNLPAEAEIRLTGARGFP